MSDINVWNEKNLRRHMSFRHFPSEMVLRGAVSDNYFNGPTPQSGKVLDIGCLRINNLVPFAERGFECFGTEVTEESLKIAKECADMQNIQAKLTIGYNQSLPYEKEAFELVLSIATIHYEESVDDVGAAVKEFHRVTKDEGVVFIKTVAPNHFLYTKSKQVNDFSFRFCDQSDIRNDQLFTFFPDFSVFENIVGKYFPNIQRARITESYPKKLLDYWLLKCTK